MRTRESAQEIANHYIAQGMQYQAALAVAAAMSAGRIGKFAARRFALNRGAHPALVRLAFQLQAVEG